MKKQRRTHHKVTKREEKGAIVLCYTLARIGIWTRAVNMAPISLRKGLIDKLANDLITQLTGIEENTRNFEIAAQFTSSNFRFHRFLDVNPLEVKRRIDGLCQKLVIHSQQGKADALETLVVKFLDGPLSATDNSKGTDAHYSLLSVLLNLSDSPIHHHYRPKRQGGEAKDDNFDWTSYLLEGEEKPSLGVPTDPVILVALDDSDDEDFIIDQEREEEAEKDKQTSSEETRDVESQTQETSVVKSELLAVVDDDKDYKWLQENVILPYWKQYKIADHNFTNVRSVSALCSITYNWELYKRQNTAYPQAPFGKLLTEKQIARETLWSLQGVTDLFVYNLIDKKIYVAENIVLSHITKETLQKYLTGFAEHATVVSLIKGFINDCTSPDTRYSKTFRAFGCAVAAFMKVRSEDLAKIETEIINSEKYWTLAALKKELAPDLSVVSCIHRLYRVGVLETFNKFDTAPEQVLTFLDTFYDLICSLDTVGIVESRKLSVLLPVFIQTIRPYLQDVDDWMMYGRLPSNDLNEFFIYRMENFSRNDLHYWQKTFQLRIISSQEQQKRRISVAKFLLPVVSQILLAGKSLGLLQDFGKLIADDLSNKGNLHQEFLKTFCSLCNVTFPKEGIDEKQERISSSSISAPGIPDRVDISPFLALNNKLLAFPVNKDNKRHERDETRKLLDGFGALRGTEICPGPASLVIGHSLYPSINKRYEKASCLLLNLFKNEFGLMEHLERIQNFFLLAAGDTMRLFYHELFEKARFNGFWQDVSYLNIVLQDALQLYHPDLIGRLTVGLRAMPDTRKSVPQVQSLDSLSLHYEVPWPMSIILDNETENRYNVIFRFLLQVKRALWSLEQLHFNDLMAHSGQDVHLNTGEVQKIRHQMFLFRVKLLHFIQGLHQYIMTRILHSTRLDFKEELQQVKDLDEILVIHNDYLEKIFNRCLLNQKVGFAKEAVIRILNLALELQVKWDAGIDQDSEEALEALQSEFSKCTKYLLSFLKNLVKRGSFPHLELLAVSLK